MPHKFNASPRQTLAKKWNLVTNWLSCIERLRERGEVTVWLIGACVHTKGYWSAMTKVLESFGAVTIAYLDAEGVGEITCGEMRASGRG